MDCMGSYSEQWTRNFTLLLSGAPTKEESINKEEEEEELTALTALTQH